MHYFEDLADLLEEEREMEFEEVYEAIGDTGSEDMGEILENYMEELQGGIPDEEQEIYMLLENIKTGMLFLCENLEDENTKMQFAEELCRFKNWYTKDDQCKVNDVPCSLMHAAACCRADALTGESSRFDFSGALDYELKDFAMSIGSFSNIDILPGEEEEPVDIDKLN